MVVVSLMGGLGNQLFQYAAARAVADRLGASLWFDLSRLEEPPRDGVPKRGFELDAFRIGGYRVLPAGIAKAIRYFERDRSTTLRRLIPGGFDVIYETPGRFDPRLLDVSGNVHLRGYFQSEDYFRPVAARLVADLEFRRPADRNLSERIEQVRRCESVAVHVRRTDYVSVPVVRDFHGPLDPGYYRAAAAVIEQRVERPRYFVFSDDPEWAATNVHFEAPTTVVSQAGPGSSNDDLQLMRGCRHQIIANSTFSWWGAWLNRNPGKVVVAPRSWFASAAFDGGYMIPPGWIRV